MYCLHLYVRVSEFRAYPTEKLLSENLLGSSAKQSKLVLVGFNLMATEEYD